MMRRVRSSPCLVVALLAACAAPPPPAPPAAPAPAPSLVLGAGWRVPAVEALCFTRDGRLVRGHLGLDVVDVDARRVITDLPRPTGGRLGGTDAWRFALSRDGSRLCVTGDQAPTRVHALPSGELVAELPTSPQGASASAFLPDGRLLVVDRDESDAQAALRVVDVDSGAVVVEGPAADPEGWVSHVAASPGGRVALAGWKTVSLVAPGQAPTPLLALEPNDRVALLEFLDEDALLVVVEGEARVVDPRSGQVTRAWETGRGPCARAGSRLAVASSEGVVTLFDVSTGRQLARLDGPRHPTAVALSPDGRRLAVGDGDLVRVWDTEAGRELTRTVGHGDAVLALGWSRDGRRLASADLDGVVHAWRLEAGAGVLESTGRAHRGVRGLAFEADDATPVPLAGPPAGGLPCPSPDGRLVLEGGYPRPVLIREVAGGQVVHELGLELGAHVSSVAWSPAGDRVALGLGDGSVLVWTAPAPAAVPAAPAVASLERVLGDAWVVPGLRDLAWTSRGLLVVGPDDVVDPATRAVVARLRAPGERDGGSERAAVSPDGALVALASDDVTRVHDAAREAQVARLEGGARIAFSADGRHLVALGDESASAYDVATWRLEARVPTPDGARCMAPPADGRGVFVSAERGLRWLALGEGPGWDLPGREGTPLLLGPSGPDRLLVVEEDAVRAVDLRTRLEVGRWDAGEVQAAALSPAGDLLALALSDGPIELRRPDGTLVARLAEGAPRVRGFGEERLAFSPDGARLATARGEALRVWDVAGEVAPTTGHRAAVTALAWSADGARLASAGKDHALRVWSADDGREERVASLDHDVLALAFDESGSAVERPYSEQVDLERGARSPRGLLARRANDADTPVLEVRGPGEPGEVLAYLGAQGERATCAAWSPDGARLAVGTETGRIRLWRLARP